MRFVDLLNFGENQLKKIAGEDAKLESELLLLESFGLTKKQLLQLLRDPIPSKQNHRLFLRQLSLRLLGTPIAYILKKTEFRGHSYKVCPKVFIPRPETELLVEEAITSLTPPPLTVIEIGVGSGIIGIELGLAWPESKIYGWDLSAKAIQTASRNAAQLKVKNIHFFHNNFFKDTTNWKKLLKSNKSVLIVTNPPYVQRETIKTLDSSIQNFEPKRALDGGASGVAFYKRLFRELLSIKSFTLICEIGYDQKEALTNLLHTLGFSHFYFKKDYNNLDRILIIKKPRV